MTRIKDEYDQREREVKEGYRDGCGLLIGLALMAGALIYFGYLLAKYIL